MREINLNSWEELEERIKGLEKDRRGQRSLSEFLYRGQGNKRWELLTTLERHYQKNLSVKQYFHLISVVKPQVESFTGEKWNILSRDEFEKWLNKYDSVMEDAFGWSVDYQNIYSYMVYLRHYGFPSPLLDWSISPYVAAYFAFRDLLQHKEDMEYVSIYIYLESKSEIGLKSGGSEAYIRRLGPYVKTDRRHFIQHSQYTICIIRDGISNGEWRYAPHEEAFARNDQNQDLLWKFNIPYCERLKVLKILNGYNLNALSLFGSKESLMETMALREIHLRDREL
jgi:FRG domain